MAPYTKCYKNWQSWTGREGPQLQNSDCDVEPQTGTGVGLSFTPNPNAEHLYEERVFKALWKMPEFKKKFA